MASLSLEGFARAEETAEPGDIVVTARATERRVLPPQIVLGSAELLDKQPTSLADALRGLPGVSVKTNSRGETIARLRGAEERQTAVFFEGAPFSVAWDGRIDLGVLPAGLIGNVTVTKGAVPIEYGTNAVAGVVDFQARRAAREGGGGFTGAVEAGTQGYINASGVATVGDERFDATIAGGYVSRDSVPVADRDALPFSQVGDDSRTNTDLDSFSIFGALGARFGAVETRVSILHNDTSRGIAPESDRDPNVAAPRYWRYPKILLTQVNLNVRAELADDVVLAGVVYRQWFDQQIDAYRTVAYTALRTQQFDDDNTLGGRLTLSNRIGPVDLRWSASYQRANHKQIDTPVPGVAGPRLEYEQNLLSLGVEGDVALGDATKLTLGAAYDRAKTPLTGDKPDQPTQDAPAFSASLRHAFGDDLTLTVSGGRRTRFATPRELYGEALGRFLINTGLKPERAWLFDAELAYRQPKFSIVVNPFYSRGEDTLGQRMVRVGNATLRQRFNLQGTKTYGVDAAVSAALTDRIGLALAGTALSARADAGDSPFRRLPQRPRHELSAVLDYKIDDKFMIAGEVLQTGSATDLDIDNTEARLPSSTEFNVRGRLTLFRLPGGMRVSATAAADNITDANVVPQLGLPLPGRIVRFGIRID
ncbi:TonB-dependent receptor plug domain-containing protein [Glacieibacterium frigidum]|uniref:TonB-dependent receptor plug domain-containing protein n=1 Tax=Glacieibacterium frigidum TaxID=2593303 RepID=UPI00163D7E0F|nr:TonB-dependent receptor [Glacieibacterium frigidum]